ncbi:hypothetical protein RFI_24233 [Reticulomyxa filosa]|uniref:Microbial-type PARG catalytic domain-containing protein n=1 Tax=Reticulomyxa filosa TaxID=46433 RepID=X6MGX1_RETFI|nr:hypothetical protein RFI_24233 [Reticulomyxa filosa]|eukprot:ETO13144.1 hypothetical protein RFI_24233 [Reticulomyxa filosa]
MATSNKSTPKIDESTPLADLYAHISDENAQKILLEKHPHNSEMWAQTFNHYSKQADKNSSSRGVYRDFFSGCQLLVQRQTLRVLQKGEYTTPDGHVVQVLKKKKEKQIVPCDFLVLDTKKYNITYLNSKKELKWMAENTKYYGNDDIKEIKEIKEKKEKKAEEEKTDEQIEKESSQWNEKYGCEIYVINGDSIDVACNLLFFGFNPVVLNMANDVQPGGGFLRGASAQEENLFRRTSYVCSLLNSRGGFSDSLEKNRKWKYPIQEFGCVYSPKLWVFRSNQRRGYTFLQQPFRMSFIAGAMYRFPKFDETSRRLLFFLSAHGSNIIPLMDDELAEKVAKNCGAFANPPEHQAEIVSNVLQEKEFYGQFKIITFAILDDHNARKKHNPDGNVQPFVQIFGKHDFFHANL